jgi:translation initiation factor IF-1
MPPSDLIRTRGKIIETVGQHAYRIELANGHRAIARPGKENSTPYQPGDTVLLDFHPYDLSRGRIIS